MTKIILFVIFLQVVFGILAKRKARKNAEEAARNPDGADGASLPSPARRHTGWGGQSEDESEAEWDEGHSEEDERSHTDTRSQQRRLPDEFQPSGRDERAEGRDRDEHPARKGIDKGKAKELGKDLLSQLAKELGLEIPPDRKPAPRPSPAPARPQPAAPSPTAKSKGSAIDGKASAIDGKTSAIEAKESASDRMAKAKRRPMEISRRSSEDYPERKRQDAGENTPRRTPGYQSTVPAAPMAVRVTASDTARASLMNVKSLRNAFILKTILDKPLSLKSPGSDEA